MNPSSSWRRFPRRSPALRAVAIALLAGPPAAWPATTAAQPTRTLTLAAAMRLADEHAYANRSAAAGADVARGTADGAWRGVLPGLSADASVVRTNDPIGAFGFLLKQRGVTAASFSPDALNHPDGVTNYGAAIVLEQPLVNVDAWMGLRAARVAATATGTAARWTATSVRADVVHAYYGAIVAGEMANALAAAERAALEHVRVADVAAANGFTTRSDILLARVRAGDVAAQRIEADSRARTARVALALLLGVPGDTAFTLPSSLPAPEVVVARLPAMPGDRDRDDVRAAREAATAARLDLRRAQGALLPRINGFARYDWNAATRFGAAAPALTVGAAASWSLFGGGREIADARVAAARVRKAESDAEGAASAAALDRRNADESFTVALARAAIADTSVQQSAEALRIVRKKYEGGIADVSELLTAAAAEMQARVMQADARYRVLAASAARLRAWGADPAALAALDPDLR
jgi:outer membrane protein TolC